MTSMTSPAAKAFTQWRRDLDCVAVVPTPASSTWSQSPAHGRDGRTRRKRVLGERTVGISKGAEAAAVVTEFCRVHGLSSAHRRGRRSHEHAPSVVPRR